MSTAAPVIGNSTATARTSAVALRSSEIAPDVLAALPRVLIEERQVLPFAYDERGRLRIAAATPDDIELSDLLTYIVGRSVRLEFVDATEIRAAITRCYRLQPTSANDTTEQTVADDTSDERLVAVTAGDPVSDAPVLQWVESLIAEAERLRASDIHLEPLARRFRVRYRVDGVLREGAAPPRELQLAIISRLKLMANISIAEKRLPQDGRILFEHGAVRLDLRVASLPTVHGESLVLRVLEAGSARFGLENLGLLAEDQERFRQLTTAADGITLVTGPTGSGKTTTLYTCLQELGRTPRKIITVEDPIERQMPGINQVPVNASIGLTFAAALRAMLRQSPNVIMVGEIRDRETAEIAIQAALTGHQIFSTLHTNDAASAVTRLVDMGAKSFLVAAALRAVVAQRLVRRVCAECAEPQPLALAELRAAGWTADEPHNAIGRMGRGCAACEGTGYRGQLGLFEIFLVNDELRRLIHEQAGVGRLRACARRHGFRTLREDGLRKVLAGLTTITEVVGATLGDDLTP